MILKDELKTSKECQSASKATPKSATFHENLLGVPEKCKYFTCLTPDLFWILHDFLGQTKITLNYWNKSKGCVANLKHSLSFQLFVISLRLRREFNICTIAFWYDVSRYSITTIFRTWVMFLFHHYKYLEVVMFVERQHSEENMPKMLTF